MHPRPHPTHRHPITENRHTRRQPSDAVLSLDPARALEDVGRVPHACSEARGDRQTAEAHPGPYCGNTRTCPPPTEVLSL
jgi:hypothetical protein